MKIGYICVKNLRTSGGVEKYTWEMSKRLAARGHEVYIFSTDKVVPEQIKGIHVITIPSFGGRFFEKITGSAFATFKALKIGLDVFHFQAFGAGMFAFVPRLFGKVTVAQGHGIEWKRAKWGVGGKAILRITEYLSVKYSTHVLAVSHTQASDITERYGREVEVVSGGISPPQRIPADEITTKFGLQGNDYFLIVARLVPEKGAHYLIEAFTKTSASGIKLIIVGDAERNSEYNRKIVSMARYNEDIVLAGFQTGKILHELFSNAYAYVLPSEIEGLSISLLEAMSYGLCCVISDIPENLEATDKSRYGIPFASRDADDLSRQLERVLEMGRERARIGVDARKHVVEQYNWDGLAHKLESFYLRIARPNKAYS